jgi:hypothetical protein
VAIRTSKPKGLMIAARLEPIGFKAGKGEGGEEAKRLRTVTNAGRRSAKSCHWRAKVNCPHNVFSEITRSPASEATLAQTISSEMKLPGD